MITAFVNGRSASWICFRAITLLCLQTSLLSSIALAQQHKRISLEGLIEAIKIGGLSEEELAGIVVERGVDFRPTPEAGQQLRTAGASEPFIGVVRRSYRSEDGSVPEAAPPETPSGAAPVAGVPGPEATPPRVDSPDADLPPWEQPGPALSKDQILLLLQSGTPPARVERMIQVRGMSFDWSPEIGDELQSAGGRPSLMELVESAGSANALPGSAPATGPPTIKSLLSQGYRPLPVR